MWQEYSKYRRIGTWEWQLLIVQFAFEAINNHRFVLKIGAGHGKSIIVMILAMAYLKKWPNKKIIIITLNEYLKQQMYFRHSWRHGCSVYPAQNEKIILMTWAEFAQHTFDEMKRCVLIFDEIDQSIS